MPNLLDLLSDEDKAKVETWKERRLSKGKRPGDIPGYLYAVAELGYYYGWPAIEAVKRGYIPAVEKDGSVRHIPFTADEMYALLTAAQKVAYRKQVETGDIAFSASFASQQPKAGKVFDKLTKPFREKAQ